MLPRPLQRAVEDVAAGGDGRGLFVGLCALHDVGKATPGFQAKHPVLARAVEAAGLPCGQARPQGYRHELACRQVLRRVGVGSLTEQWRWALALLSGHHGVIRSASAWTSKDDVNLGREPAWAAAQRAVVTVVLDELSMSLPGLEPVGMPGLAHQLALSGWLIACDWVASSLAGHDDLDTAGWS